MWQQDKDKPLELLSYSSASAGSHGHISHNFYSAACTRNQNSGENLFLLSACLELSTTAALVSGIPQRKLRVRKHNTQDRFFADPLGSCDTGLNEWDATDTALEQAMGFL